LIFSESDNLPGLIVDRYADYLVAQFLTAGTERHKQPIVSVLQESFPAFNIYERSDEQVRKKEGLPLNTGILIGKDPPPLLAVAEGDCQFWVDLQHGHKTGFYIDQSTNRQQVRKYVYGKEVLNCFSYTGGFTVAALKGGACKVINIDSSASVLDIVHKNLELNRMDTNRSENITGDVFKVLRQFRDDNRQFDVIILDPPRFADSRRQILKAARGYKDINWLACRLIKPGGILITFSCSGALKADLFQKILADAALDAGRSLQIIQNLVQSADHPVALHFPESLYLKGMVCRVW
jgi:23S rRNA (cytosine1962-C5)-methyltransferase